MMNWYKISKQHSAVIETRTVAACWLFPGCFLSPGTSKRTITNKVTWDISMNRSHRDLFEEALLAPLVENPRSCLPPAWRLYGSSAPAVSRAAWLLLVWSESEPDPAGTRHTRAAVYNVTRRVRIRATEHILDSSRESTRSTECRSAVTLSKRGTGCVL